MRSILPLIAKLCVTTSIVLGGMPTALKAQEDPDSMVRMIERVGNLEEDLRALRGQLEESRHEVNQLRKQLETVSADLAVRPSASASLDSSVPPLGEPLQKGEDLEISSPQDPEAAYQKARNFLEVGDYVAAEKELAAFLELYPKHAQAGAALYWLGVTYFIENQFEKAAAHFAKVYRSYPKSPKVPDSLLKLAKTLKALGRKTDACTSLEQLSKDFPSFSPSEVASERKNYQCH